MPKEAIEPEVLEQEPELETVEPEAPETTEETETDQTEASEEEEEETFIGFGDEAEEEETEADNPTIKRLRERNREQTRLLREKERELEAIRHASAPQKIELGPEPTLEDCGWDEEVLKQRVREYDAKKKDVEALTERAEEKSRKVVESYTRDLESYRARKAALAVPDIDDAEAAVIAALSVEQQAVAVQAANDPATLIVALGRSPAKLAELAKIENPWKLAAAIARMEGQVKVTKTKKSPPPDRPQRGSASMAAVDTDKELARLEKEADRTGIRTDVIAYKRQLAAKGK